MPVFLCLAAADNFLTAQASSLESFMAEYGATVFDWRPTTLCVLFQQGDALNCALALHSQLLPEVASLGMALHVGPYERLGRLVLGAGPIRSRHVAQIAWGGQILLTQEYVAGVGTPPEAATKALGVQLLTDLAQPAPLYQLLHPDLATADFPPLRSLSYYPNNLRAQTTAFVGRARELRELVTQLQSPARRLMTLTGPGGIGKTRLALQVAAEAIRDFPQGAFFIPCEAISAGGLLPSMIAQALQLPFSDRLDPRTQLLNQLRRRTLLLVLDNYEPLWLDGTLLTEILAQAPRVKILLTSREPLRLPEEYVYPLDGLAFPRHDRPADVAAFETFDAVQLFFLAALRADPMFSVAEDARDAVISICELVEGLPLALELAATWARMFSCQEIVREIARGLDFLQGARRDLSARHRSLRAVFESTWRQLAPTEQAVFAQCALFHGPFSEAAAQVVAAAPPAALSALVHKSMLVQTASQRYKLHPLLRHYATEQLTVTPDLFAAFEERHGLYYLAALQQQTAALWGAQQRMALAALAEELDNIRAAWMWACRCRRFALLREAFPGLFRYYVMRGLPKEGAVLFAESAAQLRAWLAETPLENPVGQQALADCLLAEGVLAASVAQNDRAQSLLDAARKIYLRYAAQRE